jgi:alpha-beta hydrolase superfamily lysophospholipase
MRLVLGSWRALLIAGFVLIAAACLVAVGLLGGAQGDDFVTARVERNGTSEQLVVLLHAWHGRASDLAEVKGTVRRQLPNSDILAPEYVADLFSNNDPLELASKLDRRLEQIVQDARERGAGYRSIILIGHSAGALILRRAYLYGMGYRSDHFAPELRQLEPHGESPPSTWVNSVDRMVLLASMNRGWDLRMIDNRTWTTQAMMMWGVAISELTGTGKLVMALERGAPFVGNLRLDWLRMVRRQGTPVTPIIQLLGEKDDLVQPGDDIDVVTAPNFIFIRLDDTDHNNIRLMSPDDSVGRERAAHFTRALTAPVAELRSSYQGADRLITAPKIKHVVFIKHGIRDMADWSSPLRNEFEKASDDVAVICEKFPYFSMMSFLLWWDRQSEVRRFVDEYANALAQYPNYKKVSYVGHSFGTYIVASALERYPSISFHKLYFAGSAVRRDYDWANLGDRFQQIRNDRADGDWVVAVFPRAFEQLRSLIRSSPHGFLDVGSAGFNGFIQDRALDVHYLHGGHGAGLDFKSYPKQAHSIVSFIVGDAPGKGQLGSGQLHEEPQWLVKMLGQIALLAVIALIAAAVYLGRQFNRGLVAKGVSQRVRTLSLAGYAGFIFIVLNTF